MPKESNSRNQILMELGIMGLTSLPPESPHDINDLADQIARGQVGVLKENEEVIRLGRSIGINVYYETSNGHLFISQEERYVIVDGRTFEEYLAGDTTVLRPSSPRQQGFSVNERLNVDDTKEDLLSGAVRALREELFDFALNRPENLGKYQDLDSNLAANLTATGESFLLLREKDDPSSGYLGIKSKITVYPFQIKFNPLMLTPIQVDTQGKPKSLIEHAGKYVNIHTWHPVV